MTQAEPTNDENNFLRMAFSKCISKLTGYTEKAKLMDEGQKLNLI